MTRQLTGDSYKLNVLFTDILTSAMNAYDAQRSAEDGTSYRVAHARYTLCLELLHVSDGDFARFVDAYRAAVKTYEETDKSDFFDHFMGAPLETDYFRAYFGFDAE